jgi:hypothetical protein
MAWFRLISWWINHKPISHSDAVALRNLLMVQTVAVLVSLLIASLMTWMNHVPAAIYALGFGTGFVVAVRYYVWRYIG